MRILHQWLYFADCFRHGQYFQSLIYAVLVANTLHCSCIALLHGFASHSDELIIIAFLIRSLKHS